MTSLPGSVLIGVDVSQERLDLAVISRTEGTLLRREHVPNTRHGHRRVVALSRSAQAAHVVMEATGNYHRKLLQVLDEAELDVSVINPLQCRRFGQMKLRRVKTDRSDALLLAEYGREQKPPRQRSVSAEQEQMRQIASLSEQLTKQRTALKNLEHAGSLLPEGSGICREVIRQQLEQLDETLKRLQAEQERLAKVSCAEARHLAESVKGVGCKTALALVAYAGDLSCFTSAKQLVAFVGLNPVPNQSGKKDGPRHISKQGHARLRTLFYMGAQAARRHNRACRELYERLIAAGKRKKVALIAVAGKLIRQVFAVIKSGLPFDDQHGLQKTIAT